MTKVNKHQSFMYSNVYLEYGPGLVKDFVGPICDSYRTGRSVVKVRRGQTFSPSRKVMTELPYRPEARV